MKVAAQTVTKKKVCLSESRLGYDVGYGEQINQVNKKQ